MPTIPVLLGTVREGRRSEPVARAVVRLLQDRGVQTQLVDLADPAIPMLVERRRNLDPVPEPIERLGKILDAADALLVVTPEYNGGIPGALKNAVDHYLAEYKNKPVGIAAVSAGAGGGRSALTQARALFTQVGGVVVPTAALVARVNSLLNDDGDLADDTTLAFLGRVVDDVLWWEHAARLKRQADA